VAVTDTTGRFELSDVPSGEYEIVAWHEDWGVASQEGSFDVLTEKRVERPVFTPPRTGEKSVKLGPNGTAIVSFAIGKGNHL
jgi:hypothetical protein